MIITGIFSSYFNARLVDIQTQLLKTTRIDNSRYKMANAIAEFLIRQEMILTDPTIEAMSDIAPQEVLYKKYLLGYNQLETFAKSHPELSHILHELNQAFEGFLQFDKKLFTLTQLKIRTKEKLTTEIYQLDQIINSIINKIEGIDGILLLENKKQEFQIKKYIQTDLLNAKSNNNHLKTLASQYTSFTMSSAQQLSRKLSADFAKFANIVKSIIQTDNPDQLLNLQENLLVQSLNSIHQNFHTLEHLLQNRSELYQQAREIDTQFEKLMRLFETKNEQNLVTLQNNLIHLAASQDELIDHIRVQIKLINAKFEQLNTQADNLRTHLQEQANELSSQEKKLNISVIIMMLILMISLGYPIVHTMVRSLNTLTQTMQKITQHENHLSFRLTESTHYSELNEVSHSFNLMTEKLQFIHEHLQELVAAKTQQLKETNTQLEIDIQKRVEMETKVQILHKKLVESARLAGMADVATSVMHTIGNILNSISVSTNVLREKLHHPVFSGLSQLTILLQNHQQDLAHFISADKKGKHVLPYLIELDSKWKQEQAEINHEIQALSKNIESIENVIASQKTLHLKMNFVEKFLATEMLENLLAPHLKDFQKNDIQIVKECSPTLEVILDRYKVLQILDSLICNAIEALSHNLGDKKITISVIDQTPQVIFKVSDNGQGIDQAALSRIFTFGYTTKNDAKGLSLHASALAAIAMQGKLEVTSAGAGQGATFTLILPNQTEASTNAEP